MDSVQFDAGAPPSAGTHPVITRIDHLRWQAVEDGLVVGAGEKSRRPDGRVFLAIDTWHATVFDRLAAAMLADGPGPLSTVVDETDHDLTARWERAGLTVRRREGEYLLTTGVRGAVRSEVPGPPGVTVLGLGAATEPALRELYRVVRAEVEAGPGWDSMPVEMPPRPLGVPMDPSRYVVAVAAGRYVGLVRVVVRRRHARIGLVAVREDRRRRGIARAMLAEVLDALHRTGVTTASAEVDDRNDAAKALLAGLGARRVGGVVELGRDA